MRMEISTWESGSFFKLTFNDHIKIACANTNYLTPLVVYCDKYIFHIIVFVNIDPLEGICYIEQ